MLIESILFSCEQPGSMRHLAEQILTTRFLLRGFWGQRDEAQTQPKAYTRTHERRHACAASRHRTQSFGSPPIFFLSTLHCLKNVVLIASLYYLNCAIELFQTWRAHCTAVALELLYYTCKRKVHCVLRILMYVCFVLIFEIPTVTQPCNVLSFNSWNKK